MGHLERDTRVLVICGFVICGFSFPPNPRIANKTLCMKPKKYVKSAPRFWLISSFKWDCIHSCSWRGCESASHHTRKNQLHSHNACAQPNFAFISQVTCMQASNWRFLRLWWLTYLQLFKLQECKHFWKQIKPFIQWIELFVKI